jgi:hypothetical protein
VKISGRSEKINSIERISFWENLLPGYGTPLPPPPLKVLLGAGSANMVRKILSPLGLGVKILIPNELGRAVELWSLRPLRRSSLNSIVGARLNVTSSLWEISGADCRL